MNSKQVSINDVTTGIRPNRDSRIANDVLAALETRVADISKTMCENKTILAYEKIRQLGEFIAYERAKHSAQ
jgi:hypothetical protein